MTASPFATVVPHGVVQEYAGGVVVAFPDGSGVTVSVVEQCADCQFPAVPQNVPLKVVVTRGAVDCEPFGPTSPIGMMVPPVEFVEAHVSIVDCPCMMLGGFTVKVQVGAGGGDAGGGGGGGVVSVQTAWMAARVSARTCPEAGRLCSCWNCATNRLVLFP